MSEAAVAIPPVVTPPVVAATPTVVPPTVPTVTPGDQAKAVAVSQGAPETYTDFVADGVTLNAKAVEGFKELAKANNLTQEQAQALVTFQTGFVKGEIAAYEAQMAEDEKARPGKIQLAIANDPVLGGKDAVANAATMQRAVEAFGGTEFKAFLDKQQPDSYLAFARFALKVGHAIKEDSSAGTQSTGASGSTEFAQSFYDKAKKPNAPKVA